jgi:hypothetical protein
VTCLPMRLECDGMETLVLDSDGFAAALLDLGDAETRDVVDDAPDADGTDDTTAYIGARAVTLQLLVESTDSPSTRAALTHRLRAFTHSRIRPRLYFQLTPDDPEMMVTLRRGPFSDVWAPNTTVRNKVTVQWIAPSGIIESAALHQAVANAAGDGESGRAYDLVEDRDYGASEPLGSVNATNAGTADAYPVIRLYGPCTDPTIESLTQGKVLAFAGLTIGAGEFLEINTRAKTINYQGDPNDSRYDKFVFPTSAWWTLSPGVNRLRFAPDTFDPPSNAVVEFRDAWL